MGLGLALQDVSHRSKLSPRNRRRLTKSPSEFKAEFGRVTWKIFKKAMPGGHLAPRSDCIREPMQMQFWTIFKRQNPMWTPKGLSSCYALPMRRSILPKLSSGGWPGSRLFASSRRAMPLPALKDDGTEALAYALRIKRTEH